EIEMHNLLHDPPMPWCHICAQAKGIDACHQGVAKKPAPVIQFDYAEAGNIPAQGEEEVPNFDFAVAVDMASGFPWASSVLSHGKVDVYAIASFTSYLSELGYNKVILQSDGEQAAVAFTNQVKARIARRRHSGLRIRHGSKLPTWLPRHAAWQYARFHKRADSGMAPHEKIRRVPYTNTILMPGEAVACRRPGALLNKLETAWLEGIRLGRDSKTDEHLIGTPNGLVRSRALKRRVEDRRWDVLEAMKWGPWFATPTIRGRPPKVGSDQQPIIIGSLPLQPAAGVAPGRAPQAAGAAGPAPAAEAGAAGAAAPPAPAAGDAAAAAAPPAPAPMDVVGAGLESHERAKRARLGAMPMPPPAPAPAAAAAAPVAPAAGAAPPPAGVRPGGAQAAPAQRDGGTDDAEPPSQRRRVAALREACEEKEPANFYEARLKHIAKLTKGFEQTLQGNDDFFSATPATMHLKMMLVDAARKGHVAAIGDCSGAFYQAPLDPDGTGAKVYIEPPPEAGLPPDMAWKAVSAFPGLKGSPKAWGARPSKVLTGDMQMEQSRYDGCTFFKIDGDYDQKAGRHIDDFLVTGPKEQVNSSLGEVTEKLNMQDSVKLFEDGDEGRLLALNIRKVDGGFTLQGNPLLITDIAELLGMENATTSEVPETSNAKKQQDDDEELSAQDAVLYRLRVGKAMHLSHQRPDIQHVVDKLSKHMRAPTVKVRRMLKKLVRYLLSTREVHQLLVPRGGSDSLNTRIDSDWADDPDTRKSISGGTVMMHGCSALTWARTQKTPALSSAEAELYAIGSGAVETLGTDTLLKKVGYGEAAPAIMMDSSSALAVAKKRGPGRMKHIELKMLAVQDWIKEKRLQVGKVPTEANPADVLTKALAKEKLVRHGWELGLRGGPFGSLSWRAAVTGQT
ncbi:unnamed protein product, partial [Prorocentrum cordatum]